MSDLRREDEMSLWLHHALAAKLVADPEGVINRAKDRLRRLRTQHQGRIAAYFDEWETALNSGPHAVLVAMTDPSEHGHR